MDKHNDQSQALRGATTLALAAALAACTGQAAEQPAKPVRPAVPTDADRAAYFGQLHLHTAVSFDAYIMGTRLGLDDAYRFARGDQVLLMGKPVAREEPLDFIAITDHAEQMGVGDAIEDATSEFSNTDIGRRARAQVREGGNLYRLMTELSGSPARGVRAASESAWIKSVDAANRYYQPGKFTTLIGYEWSSTPDDQNLHRNVIFRGNSAPFPFSSQDSQRPEDLWTYLELNRRNGIASLAIPHNGNASNGLMYDWLDSDRRPISEAYAQRRLLNEPLSEIAQNKGQSETHPLLSPDDEFASFEMFDVLFGPDRKPSRVAGSYIREAYGRGLVLEKRVGANPYKFGVVGGSDFHSALSNSSEGSYGGSTTLPGSHLTDAQVRKNLELDKDEQATLPMLKTGSAALTGVWAEANTRESIFDALRRKETFATSGTRLKVRFFAGWNFGSGLLRQADWVRRAYAEGVAMGGDLPVPADRVNTARRRPRFLVWAVKDPSGANLDRAQVVKVWFDGGKPREKVFDVALAGNRRVDPRTGRAAPIGSTVNLATATYTNTIGAVQLGTVWEDPEFNPAQPSVYYVRVLEIPTPRWTTIAAVRRGLPLPPGSPPTLQERAWSSPIWYTPLGTAR